MIRSYFFDQDGLVECIEFPEYLVDTEAINYAKAHALASNFSYRIVRVIQSEEVIETTEN